MQAIVMAAGMGNRLGEITKYIPKAMVTIDNLPLINYVLRFLNHIHLLSEVIVVCGYRHEVLINYLSEIQRNFNYKLKIVENREFSKGNILSLQAGIKHVTGDFLLMNTDHIYNPKISEIFNSRYKEITAICDSDRVLHDDDMKVHLKDENIVKIDKKLETYEKGYVGMTFIPSLKLRVYKKALEQVLNEFGEEKNAEFILQYLADHGETIKCIDISGYGWVEVDTIEDKIKAEKTIKSEKWY